MLRLRFLGTGPAGGRPGRGRSRRTESSLLVAAGAHRLLIDATRDFASQARRIDRVDAVLLTHAHRDASGGIARLDRWLPDPVPLYAAPSTLAALAARYRAWRNLRPRAVTTGAPITVRDIRVSAIEVPHARDCITYAWRLDHAGVALVYASDVARLTRELEALCDACDLLVLDGAMWRRRIFTHLEIRSTIPVVARWPVHRILLTQLGRSTPDHAVLERWLRDVDPRIGAAYDGLQIELRRQ